MIVYKLTFSSGKSYVGQTMRSLPQRMAAESMKRVWETRRENAVQGVAA